MVGDALADAFARDGFIGPIRVFSPSECRRIAAYLHADDHPAPADWAKGRAVHERFLFDLAVHPLILSRVTALLGDDAVLWGASAVSSGPGDRHPWHSDIESSSPQGGFVTAWIGLEHTCRESALQLIARSHRVGKTVQEARMERGVPRDLATPETMLAAAREHVPDAVLFQPEMANGDALFFDGRLWHGSDNRRKDGRRLALLLQYAAADTPVRIPDLSQLDWPFRLRAEPRPPVIVVSGTDRRQVNRLVPAPPPRSKDRPMVATAIHAFDLPLEHPPRAWQPFPAFRGPTRSLVHMSCHASVLAGGQCPHPPHAHHEEELLIPLHGAVELLIAGSPNDPSPRIERLQPGAFVYYPAGQHHTLRNPGDAPAGYLMFKWTGSGTARATPLSTEIVRYGDLTRPAGSPSFWTSRLVDGPTSHLLKLHAHLTELAPGGGYDPHVDAYDVAIVVLSGVVETLGQTVGRNSVIYYAAGESHGMRNPGDETARYLVFEFHAARAGVSSFSSAGRLLGGRLIAMGKDLARPAWRRIKPFLPGADPQ
jgi:quercetin dioxygenase-like cupin family protein